MRSNVKFERKVNIRTRNSDRQIFWYAFAAALTAHVVFFGAFDYRRRVRQNGEGGSAVTLLPLSDFSERERDGFRKFMEYHDPLNFGSGGFGENAVDGTLRDVRPAELKTRLGADVPTRPAAVGKFREVPGRRRQLPPTLPPPRVESAPAILSASGAVTDDNGRMLPIGDVKLPSRTPETTGQTVLRVYKSGGPPVLITERSCGDAKLDRIAAHKLLFLARGETAPEFIYVEWPEARK